MESQDAFVTTHGSPLVGLEDTSSMESFDPDIQPLVAADTAHTGNDVDSDGNDVGNDEHDGAVIVDIEKTMQYLSGKISFGEYSAVLEPSHVNSSVPTSVTTVPAAPSGSPEVVKTKTRKYRQLPAALRGLMGEANINSARGLYDEAIKMCEYIIRSAPHFPDPFQTLADIYEAKGDIDKRMQCNLIAAHLKQTDSENWFSLGQEFQELNNLEQALYCYDRATRLEPDVMEYWSVKCELLSAMSGVDMKRIIDCRCHILSLLSDTPEYMKLARQITMYYNDSGDIDKALSILLAALKKHPTAFTAEDFNCILDLYFIKSVYDKSLLVLLQYCGVCLYYDDGSYLVSTVQNPVTSLPDCQPVRCIVPSDMKIDLKAKLIICLIHIGYCNCFQNILDEICRENPDEVGDLFLDIAEAYMSVGVYSSARPLLYCLVTSSKYNMPAVWLRYAECLSLVNELTAAVAAYEQVVALVPSHFAARVSLSALHQQLGHPEDALKVLLPQPLTNNETDDTDIDVRLLMPCCHLLYGQQKFDEFVMCAKQVMLNFCRGIFDKHYLGTVVHYRALRGRFSALRHAFGQQFEKPFRTDAKLDNNVVNTDDLWELFIKLCKVLVDQKKYEMFENVSILALLCPQFVFDPTKCVEADFVCLTACMLNKNGQFAYNIARDYCLKNLDNNCAWNIFCQIINMSQDARHNRFCLRLAMKHPEHFALGVLNGHNAMISGSYKHAIGEYTSSLKQSPDDPLLHLLIGVVFVHMACQKFSLKRHLLITQSCAFLNQYLELRGDCQETYYNLGRAMQQVGLNHAAVHYYQKALQFPVPVTDDDPVFFDLRRDIAFNLRLIYIKSGSFELAEQLTQQYLVV